MFIGVLKLRVKMVKKIEKNSERINLVIPFKLFQKLKEEKTDFFIQMFKILFLKH